MVRIIKEPEERKSEILDVAEELFHTKGYEVTTTNDILEKAGIARGTLYYYFKSKDEIMDAVIERSIDRQIQGLMFIVNDQHLNALEKFQQIFLENQKLNHDNELLLEYLHQPENSKMHQKSLIQSVLKSAPVIAKIISQGVAENLFQTDYPLELSEFVLVGMNFLFDQSIFPRSQAEIAIRMKVLADIMETSLRVKQGSFSFVYLPDQARNE